MAGAMKVVSKGKTFRKVALSVLALLRRPPFEILADLIERLIEGACWHKEMLVT